MTSHQLGVTATDAEHSVGPENRRAFDLRRVIETNGPRAASFVFVALLPCAFVFYLVVGRHRWFWSDEWDFLTARDAGNVGDLMRPFHGHWSLLPIVAFRLLWHAFRLDSYAPYQALVILLHLTIGALLRITMRRAGAGPWLATVGAASFVLFGPGHDDFLWAFQIGFCGSLVFGLTHLLLADHDGPVDRRDWLGLTAGFCGLLCSGLALSAIAAVGSASLVRRGWRIALLHTVPLASIYGVWWFSYARFQPDETETGSRSLWSIVQFVVEGTVGTFSELGHLPGMGIAFAVMFIAGVVALASGSRSLIRSRIAVPLGLAIGGLTFLATAAVAHAFYPPQYARLSRYLLPSAAFFLPAFVAAVSALARRARFLNVIVIAVIAIGVPGNVLLLIHHERGSEPFYSTLRSRVLLYPRIAAARSAPDSLHPEPVLANALTMGWLKSNAAAGRLPRIPRDATALERANATLALTIGQSHDPAGSCRTLAAPIKLRLEKGTLIRIGDRATTAQYVDETGTTSALRVFDPSLGRTLTVFDGPIDVTFTTASKPSQVRLCNMVANPDTSG